MDRGTSILFWLLLEMVALFIAFRPGPAVLAEQTNGKVTFEADIQPLLTRFGCNAGPCHGKSRGQNGFALSLLGFDSDFDYSAIVEETRGRRLFPSAPEQSLLLKKATGLMPHGGGKKFAVGSPSYELILSWIREGAPRTPPGAPRIVRVVTEPANQRLFPGGTFPLKVFAEYSDGKRRDVTDGAAFQSNDNTVASPGTDGVIKAGSLPGEAAIMARYMNQIAVCNVIIPMPGQVPEEEYNKLPRNNPIDQLVWDKLKLLGVTPSGTASEATFHRRAYLRIIGRLPTPEETRAYLADPGSQRREQLVDRLLNRPEYADFWANKWADLLRPNPYRVGMKATWNLDSWLRDAFRKNKPYDQFARELVTATGSTWKHGATVIFRDRPEPVEIASMVSHIFLGVRLECARCHHHPFEIWSQDDFYGFAALFARVGHEGGISPPISGGEEIIFTAEAGQLKHGRTGNVVSPQLLGDRKIEPRVDQDPRQLLADWMTRKSNPFFARVMANRIWSEMMGQGIVEPVDDLRATNPPCNEPLLEYLAQDFRDQGYDIKKLIRRIALSQVFALASRPGSRNASDIHNFSRYYRQRMRAEILLDATNDVLGTEEKFDALPPGSRATQVWTHRVPSTFLDTFGRPDLNQDPPCERLADSTTPQILHLMNSPELNARLGQENGRPAKLAATKETPEKIVEEIYLLTLCRFPGDAEKKKAVESLVINPNRRVAIEDLFWALLNNPEFFIID